MELGLTTQSRPISLPGSRHVRPYRKHVCCGAKGYFPHHRLHLTSSGVQIPQLWTAAGTWQRRGARLAPEPASYSEEQLAALLRPERWQLAYGSTLENVQARLNRMATSLACAYEQAKALWQYVVASWPAWTASLCEDVEYVLEYTLGILPAWLISMKTALQGIYNEIRVSAAVQHLVFSASSAARDVRTNINRLQQAVVDINQLASSRLAEAPPLQQLVRMASNLANNESSSAATNVARGLTHSMAALTAAELAVHFPSNSRRGKAAQGLNETASLAVHSGDDAAAGSINSRLQLMGLLPEDVQEGLRSGRAAAGSSLQHLVIEPLQQAGFISSSGKSPTLAGVIAAASVVLAASVYRGMQRQEQQAEERMLQQVQLQIKAESLAAQRARFRRALDDSQAASAAGSAPAVNISTRRRAASPADDEEWEDSLAHSSPLMPKARASGGPHAVMPELDAAAAQEFHRFMASAKADGVPMWDSHMVDDLPKVSMKELQRQTQKIRSAATEEERAAMEDAETRRQLVEQQLNSQLAELQGAPIGRAAREKWRKEQQAKQKEQAQQQQSKTEAGAAADKGSKADKSGSDFNPFAISSEARAQWEAEDHLYSDAPARKGGAAGANSGWEFGGIRQRQQQQQTAQPQHARRRRFADEPTTGALPVMGAPSPTPPCNSSPSNSSRSSNELTEAAGPAEGTPEWEAMMREEMMRSGAARRARRQQMMQQQQYSHSSSGAATAPNNNQFNIVQKAGASAEAAAAATPRNLPVSSLQRPSWPGAAVSTAAARAASDSSLSTHSSAGSIAAVGKEHQQQMEKSAAAEPPTAAVAARDVQKVTPSIRLPAAAAVTAEGAATAEAKAEAHAAAVTTQDNSVEKRSSSKAGCRSSSRNSRRQDGEEGNPFVVDKADVIDDETAFELGKVVDRETKRIRLDGF